MDDRLGVGEWSPVLLFFGKVSVEGEECGCSLVCGGFVFDLRGADEEWICV